MKRYRRFLLNGPVADFRQLSGLEQKTDVDVSNEECLVDFDAATNKFSVQLPEVDHESTRIEQLVAGKSQDSHIRHVLTASTVPDREDRRA
jgi:hypothetical protein